MKKSKTVQILEILGEGLMTAADIITVILESGYGASYSKLTRNYSKIESRRLDSHFAALERQRFYNLISKLKREGLIEGNRKLKITRYGKEKILKSRNVAEVKVIKYKPEKDDATKIIIFDIPERERYKRNWLRTSLLQLGFKLLQKSVWIGKVKIPEEFIEDLKFMKIDRCVHVFSADKLGTIDTG